MSGGGRQSGFASRWALKMRRLWGSLARRRMRLLSERAEQQRGDGRAGGRRGERTGVAEDVGDGDGARGYWFAGPLGCWDRTGCWKGDDSGGAALGVGDDGGRGGMIHRSIGEGLVEWRIGAADDPGDGPKGGWNDASRSAAMWYWNCLRSRCPICYSLRKLKTTTG